MDQKDSFIYALAFSLFGGASVLNAENVGFIAALIGALFTLASFLFTRINKMVNSYQQITNSVVKINKELFPENGVTLKELVFSLKIICERIEKNQKIIEQKSKSTLHFNEYAIFETDKQGLLVWANDNFFSLGGMCINDVFGNNWYAMISENKREHFIDELSSCLKMCRKFEITTETCCGTQVKFYGYPYKIDESQHEGFLFRVVKCQEHPDLCN
jgi:hypothetical protein